MPLRSRNAAVLAKIESTAGTFESPSASTDGVLVEAPSIDFNPENVNTNEVTGSLDGRGPIVGGTKCSMSFTAYLKGPATPGVQPEWGDLMKACAFAETITVTTITATTISFAASGAHILDSGSGLAALTVGTVIFVSGAVNAANNGEFLVATSAAGDITVTKPDGSAAGIVTESAGASVSIRRGIAGVAATAGDATGFTAQSPWAGTLQLYRFMPVLLSGNPATPAFSFISDYTAARVAALVDLFGTPLSGSTKVSIPANVLYVPATNSIPALSMEYYIDGVVYRFRGCRGSVNFDFAAAGACRAQFAFQGLFQSKADASVAAPTYDGTRPPTFRNSKFEIQRIVAGLKTFSLNAAANLVFPANPNDAEGFDLPLHVSRDCTGQMDPYARLVATQDLLTAFRAGTEHILHARVTGGVAAAGNRIGATVPAAFYTKYTPGDAEGIATEAVPFFARGQDSAFGLCVY